MEHLLLSYSKVAFYDGFKKIGFDILKNLSEYCEKYSCYYLLEDICHNVNEKVQDSYFDYYAKKDIYDTRLDILNKFRKIYREIQLSNIL